MTFIHNRRVVATIVTAARMAVPAQAAADSLPSTYNSYAAQSGIGAPSESAAQSTFPPAGFRGGDTPVDHPGASRAPTAAPTTNEVVRPERTIVRDVDEAHPLIPSGTALLLVLAGLGITPVHTRTIVRAGH